MMIMTNIIILLIFIILALIHLLAIILIERFHNTSNILIDNFCLCSLLCTSFWSPYYILSDFYRKFFNQSKFLTIIIAYFQIFVNYLVVYSLVMITINRYFIVMYSNKRLFKSKRWSFISLVVQWMITIILSVPRLAVSVQINIDYR